MKSRTQAFPFARPGAAATALALLHLLLAAPAFGQERRHQENDPGAAPAKAALRQAASNRPSHVVREGNVERRLWIDDGRVAEFGNDGPPLIRSAAPGEVDAIGRGSDAKAGALKSDPPATGAPGSSAKPVSPVFRDASGRPRALPGGVIVTLEHGLPEDQARSALEAGGLVPLRQIGERMWLVDSPPGIASLELANRLQAEGRFGFAQPNWWQPKTTK